MIVVIFIYNGNLLWLFVGISNYCLLNNPIVRVQFPENFLV